MGRDITKLVLDAVIPYGARVGRTPILTSPPGPESESHAPINLPGALVFHFHAPRPAVAYTPGSVGEYEHVKDIEERRGSEIPGRILLLRGERGDASDRVPDSHKRPDQRGSFRHNDILNPSKNMFLAESMENPSEGFGGIHMFGRRALGHIPIDYAIGEGQDIRYPNPDKYIFFRGKTARGVDKRTDILSPERLFGRISPIASSSNPDFAGQLLDPSLVGRDELSQSTIRDALEGKNPVGIFDPSEGNQPESPFRRMGGRPDRKYKFLRKFNDSKHKGVEHILYSAEPVSGSGTTTYGAVSKKYSQLFHHTEISNLDTLEKYLATFGSPTHDADAYMHMEEPMMTWGTKRGTPEIVPVYDYSNGEELHPGSTSSARLSSRLKSLEGSPSRPSQRASIYIPESDRDETVVNGISKEDLTDLDDGRLISRSRGNLKGRAALSVLEGASRRGSTASKVYHAMREKLSRGESPSPIDIDSESAAFRSIPYSLGHLLLSHGNALQYLGYNNLTGSDGSSQHEFSQALASYPTEAQLTRNRYPEIERDKPLRTLLSIQEKELQETLARQFRNRGVNSIEQKI